MNLLRAKFRVGVTKLRGSILIDACCSTYDSSNRIFKRARANWNDPVADLLQNKCIYISSDSYRQVCHFKFYWGQMIHSSQYCLVVRRMHS